VVKPIDPQAAVEQMWKTAPLLAKAKGERVYLERYRESLKAILMKSCNEQSAAAQEREALAHPDYLEHLIALRAAVENEELLKWRMVAAEAGIDVWRSTEASNRMTDRATQ
jgi:CHASE3 domain sensor protein